MTEQFIPFLAACGLLAIWVCLPLIPAWIKYRVTPDQKLGLMGPFQGLTVKASGAFTAYVVVLLEIGRAHV